MLNSENEIRILLGLVNEIEPALSDFFLEFDEPDERNETFFADQPEFNKHFASEEPPDQFEPEYAGDNFPLTDMYYEATAFPQKFVERLYHDCKLPAADRKLELTENVWKYIWSEVSPSGFENLEYFRNAELNARKILLFRQVFLLLSQVNRMFADKMNNIEITKLIDSKSYFEESLGLRKYLQYTTRSEVNREIKSFIYKITALGRVKLILTSKNLHTNGLETINLINQIEWETVKRCPVCAKFFIAGRKDAQTCSAKCSIVYRQRQWYKKQKS